MYIQPYTSSKIIGIGAAASQLSVQMLLADRRRGGAVVNVDGFNHGGPHTKRHVRCGNHSP